MRFDKNNMKERFEKKIKLNDKVEYIIKKIQASCRIKKNMFLSIRKGIYNALFAIAFTRTKPKEEKDQLKENRK